MKNISSQHTPTLSRRKFIKTTGGFAFLIGATGILPQIISCKSAKEIDPGILKQLTAWVHLSSNGQVTIYNPAAEMGQGSMTSLPVIFSEEMDADWDKVKVEFSPQEKEVYGSPGWDGKTKIMMTVGSRTTRSYFTLMRQAGAQARYVLLHSVSQHWQVPISELTTEPGVVVHAASDRKVNYGDIVSFLQTPESIPEIPEEQLKNPQNFRLIGKEMPRWDIPSKTDGSAQFAMDIRLPDMLYATIERGNLHGAKPTLKNEAAIRAMEGVIGVVTLDYGIGVIANTLERALAVKKQLDIEWGGAQTSGFNSQEAFSNYEKVLNGTEKGRELTNTGDFKKARQAAAKTYTASFRNDYVYHAQMEPLNAIVQLAADGKSAEVWVGSQSGPNDKEAVAEALGLEPSQVKVHLQYLGGGFGRRSAPDAAGEAAMLAKTVAPRPVKLIWTREDDLQYGMYRPMSLQRLTACTDGAGNVTGFSHLVAGDGANLLTSGIGIDYYDIPNQYAEVRVVPHGVRIKHWRAVGHGPNKFAIESFIDEIATGEGGDPVEFRRKLMKNSPRALATLDKAAEMAKWGTPLPEGRARGVAFIERSGTLTTGICEISLDPNTGKIKVHHFWSASDAGIIVQPDNVRAQIEGGIVMGIGSVLSEQITIVDGKVQQSNFHDYHIARMEDTPETIETALIDSQETPQGVGESGTPLVACAIANAFAALTGKRLRHLPFTGERVLEVLG